MLALVYPALELKYHVSEYVSCLNVPAMRGVAIRYMALQLFRGEINVISREGMREAKRLERNCVPSRLRRSHD